MPEPSAAQTLLFSPPARKLQSIRQAQFHTSSLFASASSLVAAGEAAAGGEGSFTGGGEGEVFWGGVGWDFT
ncbi:hypothetical protein E2C01_020991 [Portunus trituberculatus]|uniref:Uncharacterized protein n=1 Tax=Portunus trituberculatus TaxID=210409 RepID=A0A5B7E225_PORTR|nr:hypothetical protein [Portunus trituberculatus]